MDTAFQRTSISAIRGRGPVVYGLELQDLTLGHVFLLAELNSPFVAGSEPPEFYDLLIAALVCSCRHEESRRALRAWWLPLFLRVWRWVVKRRNFWTEYCRFLQYWSHAHQGPRYLNSIGRGNTRTLNTPGHWRLLVVLMRDLHMTREAALDTPFRLALCLEATVGDLEGTIELESQRLRDLHAHAERQAKTTERPAQGSTESCPTDVETGGPS